MTRHQNVGPSNGKRYKPKCIPGYLPDYGGELAAKLRSSRRWQRLRKTKLTQDPICEWCSEAPAEEVHHVERVADNPDRAFDTSNLQSLCTECHQLVEGAKRRGIDIERIKRETPEDAMRHGREMSEADHGRQFKQRTPENTDGNTPSPRK